MKDEIIVKTMAKFGGKFEKILAELWQSADSVNRARIKDGWPDYWEKYEALAKPVAREPDPREGQGRVIVESMGETYLVRRVNKGDHYGLNMCLTHDKDEPMVEFYVAETKYPSYDFVGEPEEAKENGAPVLGYFVSRYNLHVLTKDREADSAGICLHYGGQYSKSYNVDQHSLMEALNRLGLLDEPF